MHCIKCWKEFKIEMELEMSNTTADDFIDFGNSRKKFIGPTAEYFCPNCQTYWVWSKRKGVHLKYPEEFFLKTID
jgi:hypothetical protein